MENQDAVMELYRSTVRDLLSGTRSDAIPNSSHRHAAIILEELARCSRHSFHAFCGRLSADVWSAAVKEQLRMAIARKVDVNIILAHDPESPVPDFLKDHIRMLDLSDVGGDQREAFESVKHFAAVDGKSARLEDNPADRTALFVANQPEVTEQLDQIFAILSERTKAA